MEFINRYIHISTHVHAYAHTPTHTHTTPSTIANQNFTIRHHYILILRKMTKTPTLGIKSITKYNYLSKTITKNLSLSKPEKTQKFDNA